MVCESLNCLWLYERSTAEVEVPKGRSNRSLQDSGLVCKFLAWYIMSLNDGIQFSLRLFSMIKNDTMSVWLINSVDR